MKLTITLLLSIFWMNVLAQDLKITGKVSDKATGKPIPSVAVKVLNSQKGAVSNSEGQYEITGLSNGMYEISVSHIGYATINQQITLENDSQILNFDLNSESQTLDEVVVQSATKQEAELLKVPTSISLLSEAEIGNLPVWSTRDISGLTANVYAPNAGEAEGINFSIRGIQSLGFDPSVVTYVDGVNQFDLYSSIDYIHNIENIEILKGPQGTLFGRNAMGGVVNITTKQPSNELEVGLEATFGNFNLQRYNLFASGALVKDKLFFSIGGLFADRDGYFTNTFDNSNFNGTTYGGATFSLKYQLNNAWSFTITAKRYERQIEGYLPFAQNDSLAFANPFETQQNAPGETRNTLNQIAFTTKHTGKSLNFTNVFSYQDRELALDNVDVDFSPADFNTYTLGIPGVSNIGRVFTNEFTFSNPANANKFRWIAGSYAFWQDLPANDITSSGADAALFDPTAPNQVFGFREGTNRGIAFFGQATYAITPKIEASAGLRYDYEKRELKSKTDFAQGENPAITIIPEETRENDFSAFLPKFSISYFPFGKYKSLCKLCKRLPSRGNQSFGQS